MRSAAILVALACLAIVPPMPHAIADGSPDLFVSEAQSNGTFEVGASDRFGAYVENWGATTPADATVRFELDGAWLADGTLPAGSSGVTLVESPALWTATAGWHTLHVVADPDNAIAESDETNNELSWTFFVSTPLPPPPARESIYLWSAPSNASAYASESILVPKDYHSVWFDLRCPFSTAKVLVDGALMATCANDVRTDMWPDTLAAGPHTFTIVFAAAGSASLEVSGVAS